MRTKLAIHGKAMHGKKRLLAAIAGGTLAAAFVPTAGLALNALDARGEPGAGVAFAALTPASVDPRLAELVATRSGGAAGLLRFTPAGVAQRANRSITVAIRVNEEEARAISVRSAIEAAKEQVAAEAGVRIAPTRYNLGLSRDYQSFAKAEPLVSRTLSDARIPDLADFRPSPGAREEQSRFAARIELDDTGAASTAARTLATRDRPTVDVEGSYRLTRNLDVTAGVRYSQEHDRLAPLPSPTRQDSQAVYVGTQFRF